MTEITILISTLITNLVVGMVKVPSYNLTPEEKEERKKILRTVVAIMTVLTTVLTSWILGEPLKVDSLSESFLTIVTFVLTYATSQGAYFISKK